MVEQAGYAVVYTQPWAFIAVRQDLMQRIGKVPPSRPDWPPIP